MKQLSITVHLAQYSGPQIHLQHWVYGVPFPCLCPEICVLTSSTKSLQQSQSLELDLQNDEKPQIQNGSVSFRVHQKSTVSSKRSTHLPAICSNTDILFYNGSLIRMTKLDSDQCPRAGKPMMLILPDTVFIRAANVSFKQFVQLAPGHVLIWLLQVQLLSSAFALFPYTLLSLSARTSTQGLWVMHCLQFTAQGEGKKKNKNTNSDQQGLFSSVRHSSQAAAPCLSTSPGRNHRDDAVLPAHKSHTPSSFIFSAPFQAISTRQGCRPRWEHEQAQHTDTSVLSLLRGPSYNHTISQVGRDP